MYNVGDKVKVTSPGLYVIAAIAMGEDPITGKTGVVTRVEPHGCMVDTSNGKFEEHDSDSEIKEWHFFFRNEDIEKVD